MTHHKAAAGKTEVLINLKKANIFSIVITLAVAMAAVVLSFLVQRSLVFLVSPIAAGAFLLFLVIHEGLHGLGFMLWGKAKAEEVKFGVIWKYLMPYCTCTRLLSRSAYLKTMLLPTAAIGALSIIYALVSTNAFWALFTGVVVGGGAGGILMAREVLKCPADAVYRDHPSKPGFFYQA